MNDNKSNGRSTSNGHIEESRARNDVTIVTPTTIQNELDMPYSKRYITGVVLFVVNLLNYTDRYTIAGVLKDVQKFYNIGDGESGLLQAAFIIGYMIFSPIFGYLGDRYNRKYIMVGGIFFWAAVTLAGSFVPGEYFKLFVFMRALVGIGEASYSTIAPTLLSDMFVGTIRSRMLMLFYFAIPVGSGLGYIVGAYMAQAFGGWEWSLRFTPGLGVICCLLLLFVTRDPPRGMAEEGTHVQTTSIKADLKDLISNKSFLLTTAGGTCVAFISGALALFAPKFMYDAYVIQGNPTNISNETVALIFGIITTASGFVGVAIGTEVSKVLKTKYNRGNADPLVCAFGLIVSAPFLFVALVVSEYNMYITWALILIGEILVFLNWALMADILLYVVIPTRRGSAEACQIFLTHLLGDAGSPLLLGEISDKLAGNPKVMADFEELFSKYKSMQSSLYICTFIGVLGGFFFLLASLFIVADRAKADAIVKGHRSVLDSSSSRQRPSHSENDSDLAPLLDEEDYLTDQHPLIQLQFTHTGENNFEFEGDDSEINNDDGLLLA